MAGKMNLGCRRQNVISDAVDLFDESTPSLTMTWDFRNQAWPRVGALVG